MKYKLLVLDVDGTLVNSKKELSVQTLTTLLKIQHAGIRIALASGRSPYGLRHLVDKLEMKKWGGYILPYNGAQIIDTGNDEVLFEKRIDPVMFPYLEKKAQKNRFGIFTYHQNQLVTTDPKNEHIRNEAALNGMEIVAVENLSAAVNFSPCKCVLVSDNEDALIALKDQWRKRLAGVLDVYRSESFFLEVVPEFVDKGNTLGVLIEKLGITTDEVMAIGDGRRDFSMLQLAGLGIAMGNAQDSIKACADYTTESNDNDGVAIAVQKFIIAAVTPADIPPEKLNAGNQNTLMGNLGIQYTYASSSRIEAVMPVDERTRQPFGVLHGGATLALAETVAGMGSMLICEPDEIIVGMQVSGNHISSAHEGDSVRAVGTIIHKGRSSHVWNVDVFTSTNKLISSIRVVNSVLKKR
ncbi:MAG: Cof-type HAD-IIB family hydrolase [Proteiniphilum sp.]|uniref:Cof-type HAD-IIB family hydrolase n=1 Tax=Proteiniphilum sp. TaxID=1926877 RepID=UPI00092CA582|nr:Cof-type HAD-IIB family hydrolase [Proteiniphilum sp.]MEA5128892.1 Cof-type HAD-IIB family hydrolase [Proteiniphilum sp.]OJV88574.1 MAG: haloacid dehalogenase [Bacteroidia bacterium 44-10]